MHLHVGEPCLHKWREAEVSLPVIFPGCVHSALLSNPHGKSLGWESTSLVKLIVIKGWAQLYEYKNHCYTRCVGPIVLFSWIIQSYDNKLIFELVD